VVLGEDDEETREVADLLLRLRLRATRTHEF
jgi:hypothetical protein